MRIEKYYRRPSLNNIEAKILNVLSEQKESIDLFTLQKYLLQIFVSYKKFEEDINHTLIILSEKRDIEIEVRKINNENIYCIKITSTGLAKQPRPKPETNITKKIIQKKPNPVRAINHAFLRCNRGRIQIDDLWKKADEVYGEKIKKDVFEKILNSFHNNKMIEITISQPWENSNIKIFRDKIKSF